MTSPNLLNCRPHSRFGSGLISVLACAIALAGCTGSASPPSAASTPLAALGAQLFADPRLSVDGTTSCASCHQPQHAFTDGKSVSTGVHGAAGTRNAPSLLNVADAKSFFWDGREAKLEDVVLQPVTNPTELGLPSLQVAMTKLNAIPDYRQRFREVFADGAINERNLTLALAAHLRSLPKTHTRYEQSMAQPVAHALTAEEHAGQQLFTGKAGCSSCHQMQGATPTFTDERFHHAGVGFERIAGQFAPLLARLQALDQTQLPAGRLVLTDHDIAELGHFIVSRKPQDLGAFRTPSLRHVASTAPYMHDGSVATLPAAIDRELYYRGLAQGRPIALTVEEQRQLAAFLRAL